MWRSVTRWRGVVLVIAVLIATLTLVVQGGLVLYIHPRYIVFTIVMTAIALVLVAMGIFARPAHSDEVEGRYRRGWSGALSGIALAAAGVMAVAMVALPPATLSSATAIQRTTTGLSVGAEAQNVGSVSSAQDSVFKSFTVVDWASLLRQTSDLSFYDGKPVHVTGFITPSPDDPDNMFYVSRFVVTCCAVDAQPAGVPVYFENWSASFKADDWIEATGEFRTNPSSASSQALALKPTTVKPVAQPREPYLY
jgi:uncharacterized repeat protein (TIGR03943 family)